MADDEPQSAPAPLGMLPFAVTIFWGAFLLFLVQPLIGKYILPWFGGTPGVWTTCLLFFQLLLLGGYAYAHCLNHYLPIRKQVVVHGVLLALAVITLPITPSESLKPTGDESPTLQILLLLTLSIGLPYLVLSATGPLIQAWFAKARPGQSPYRLYALSNVGSLLALLGFPFVVEPWTARSEQVGGWSLGMLLYAAVCGYLAWHMRTVEEPDKEKAETAEQPSLPRRAATWFLWLALPACGTALLMSTTNKMCQDVAVIPFLWVLPLALYLITFIISFDSPRWYIREIYVPALVASWVGVWWVLFLGVDAEIVWQVVVLCLALFLSCMVCHGELYRLRPEPARLTQYFLAISAGGAIGGLCVAVIAPAIFTGYWEYSIALWVAALLFVLVQALRREEWRFGKWQLRGVLAVCWGAVCLGLLKYTSFGVPAKIILTIFPLLVGWTAAAGMRLALRKILKDNEGRILPAEVSTLLAAVAGVAVTVGKVCVGVAWLGDGLTVAVFWKAVSPGIWLAIGLLALNLFVWLSVEEWDGFGLEILDRFLPLKVPTVVMGLAAGIIIQWLVAFYGMAYAEQEVWRYSGNDKPLFTVGDIAAGKLDIKLGTDEKVVAQFNVKTRAALALVLTLPVTLLLCVGMWRQSAWGLRRWGSFLFLIPAMAVLAVVLVIQGMRTQRGSHYYDRNFYGTVKITHYMDSYGDWYRLLQNGRITHGYQYKDIDGAENDWSDRIVTYYTPESGAGMAMELMRRPNMRVGVVGLGVGTIAGFAQEGDEFVFYDINPIVVDLSMDEADEFNRKNGFTYCVNASSRGAKVEIVLGDARLKMEREKDRDFDVIVLDAFSSDAIPVHLLTNECMDVYDRHLAKGGVLAVHISNRYLNLEPVVKRLAQGDGKRAPYTMIQVDSYGGSDRGEDWIYACNWILLTRNTKIVQQLADKGQPAADLSKTESLPFWRDDYASIFQIMEKPRWWPKWLGGDKK